MTCPNKIYKNYTSPNEKTKQSQIGSRGFTSNLKVCNNLQPLKEKQHNPACLICHHLQYPAYRETLLGKQSGNMWLITKKWVVK